MRNEKSWLLPPLGAQLAASTSRSSVARGTGSGLRRRIARVVCRISKSGASSPMGIAPGAAGASFDVSAIGSARLRFDRGADALRPSGDEALLVDLAEALAEERHLQAVADKARAGHFRDGVDVDVTERH